MKNKVKRCIELLSNPLFASIIDVDWHWKYNHHEVSIHLSWDDCAVDTVHLPIDEFFSQLEFACEDVEHFNSETSEVFMYADDDRSLLYTLDEWIEEFPQEHYYREVLKEHYKDALKCNNTTPTDKMNWSARQIYGRDTFLKAI